MDKDGQANQPHGSVPSGMHRNRLLSLPLRTISWCHCRSCCCCCCCFSFSLQIEKGVQELQTAEKTQKRGRMFICIIALICIIVLMLIIVIIRHV